MLGLTANDQAASPPSLNDPAKVRGKKKDRMSDQPNVFCISREALVKTKARIATGDRDLQPALDKLRKHAEEALKAGPFCHLVPTLRPISFPRSAWERLPYAPAFYRRQIRGAYPNVPTRSIGTRKFSLVPLVPTLCVGMPPLRSCVP